MVSTGWASAWTWAPDLALVVASLAVLLTLTTVTRLGLLVRQPSNVPSRFTESNRRLLAGH